MDIRDIFNDIHDTFVIYDFSNIMHGTCNAIYDIIKDIHDTCGFICYTFTATFGTLNVSYGTWKVIKLCTIL